MARLIARVIVIVMVTAVIVVAIVVVVGDIRRSEGRRTVWNCTSTSSNRLSCTRATGSTRSCVDC